MIDLGFFTGKLIKSLLWGKKSDIDCLPFFENKQFSYQDFVNIGPIFGIEPCVKKRMPEL